MKPNQSTDKALTELLAQWKVKAPLPPRFQEAVWQRIERMQTPTKPSVWAVITHWIGTVLSRPMLTASYLAVLITVGATVGWAQSRQEITSVKDRLSQRYIHVLDPYQAPRLPASKS